MHLSLFKYAGILAEKKFILIDFFQDDDLEGDFDPDQYDKKMGEIFNQEYYQVENEDQKPEFPYDPEIDEGNQ